MQIINTLLARSVWFVDLQLINPLGLALGPIHSALLERYKFLRFPIMPSDFDQSKGIAYSDGQFVFEGKARAVAFTIFNTGWLADTAVSTEASDAFLHDLVEWLITLGLRIPKERIIAYESQLLVQADNISTKPFEALNPIVALVGELSENPTQQVLGFSIGGDPPGNPTFAFERRSNVPFSENKYFSRAFLTTSKHKQILDKLETILSQA